VDALSQADYDPVFTGGLHHSEADGKYFCQHNYRSNGKSYRMWVTFSADGKIIDVQPAKK
jgi:hypothetical protein